jgi:hypothetical protein
MMPVDANEIYIYICIYIKPFICTVHVYICVFVWNAGRGPKICMNHPGNVPYVMLIMHLETKYVEAAEER